MIKRYIDVCLRCGNKLSIYNGIEGYNNSGADIGMGGYCDKCKLVFSNVTGCAKRDNRIYILIVWPRDRCRNCFEKNDDVETHFYCKECGCSNYADEFKRGMDMTFGLAMMILDSRRCWDDRIYRSMPVPDVKLGDHVMGFMMGIMFGYQRSFRNFGLGFGDNMGIDHMHYGAVFPVKSRNICEYKDFKMSSNTWWYYD